MGESDTREVPVGGIWERTRQRVRDEIIETALELFLKQGFDETTVDQVAAAVGISRRSFFRYFGTKEDIVFGDLAALGPVALEALRARPEDEPVWEALGHTFRTISTFTSPQRHLAIAQLSAATPALRAAHLEKQLRWQEQLAPEVERRLGDSDAPAGLRGQAIVGTLLACVDAASNTWLASGGRGGADELQRLAERAVAFVRADTS